MTKISVVFCDDIRREDNGKHLLIGVYSGDLIPGQIPSRFFICMLARVQGLNGHHHIRLQVLSPDGSVAVEIDDNLELDGTADGFPLAIVQIPILVEGPGDIIAQLAIDGGEMNEIGSLRIFIPPENQAVQ